MNHYSAKQRESDKRWDYTCGNRRTGTYPVGYCAGWKDPSDFGDLSKDPIVLAHVVREVEEMKLLQDSFHKNGHATAEEARSCYRRYLLATQSRIWHPDKLTSKPDTLHRCELPGCEEFTAGFAEVGQSYRWFLCGTHCTAESVEKLMPEIGESWSSY